MLTRGGGFMKALVLCGDVGRLMHPLRGDKFNISFLGRPLLEHVIDRLHEAGIDKMVFVANSANRELVCRTAHQCSGATCHVVTQEGRAGMAGAVEAVADYLHGPVVVVSPNDVVEPAAYSALIAAAEDSELDGAILAYRVDTYFPCGCPMVDSESRVVSVVEKPDPCSEPSDPITVSVHYQRDGQKLLQAIGTTNSEKDDLREVALASLLADGRKVRAIAQAGFCGHLKRPWDLFPVMEHFLSGMQPAISKSARVASSAVIEGNVVLADGVRVLEHAVIRGPAYVGCGSVVGNNTLVRGGVHIGARCVVGFSTEVKHSYIGEDCWFHSNYIGDSIIDDGCSFGSGSVTANLRFDAGVVNSTMDGTRTPTGRRKLGVIMGRHCKVGINASFLPGVKVGPEAIVCPHVCLNEDLGEGMFARPVGNYEAVVSGASCAPPAAMDSTRRLEQR